MTTARSAHTFYWPGEQPCGKGHRWGGDRLNTYLATGQVVTVRTCSLCGSVRITRTGGARVKAQLADWDKEGV